MPRPRPIFTACSALSLLLCVAVCVASAWGWWRSSPADVAVTGWRTREPNRELADADRVRLWGVGYFRGSLHVAWETHDVPRWQRYVLTDFLWTRSIAAGRLGRLGVHRLDLDGYDLACPAPLAIAATALLPAAWLRRWWRRWQHDARAAAGCCIECGYDLRASLSGLCPECGSAPAEDPEPAGRWLHGRAQRPAAREAAATARGSAAGDCRDGAAAHDEKTQGEVTQ